MRVLGGSPLRVGWVTWRFTPEEARVVLAVKATFVPVDGAQCRFAAEPRFVTGDAHWDDDVELSIRWDSDLALVKPTGEAWITGTLRTSEPVAERLCSVRVGALEARFAVVGERARQRDGSVSAPVPFDAMPLCWERCFGGPGFDANPVGRGIAASADGSVPLPNVEDPDRLIRSPGDRPRPPSFLPVPRSWPERRRLMGTYDAAYGRTRWPYFPDDFQWSHFHAARREMRLRDGFWRGDEAIELGGIDARLAIVRTRLPGIRPRVFLHGADDSFVEVGTVLDTIAVDVDGPTVCCVWRGSAIVADDRLAHIEHVYVAHEEAAAAADAAAHRAGMDAWLARERQEDLAFEAVPPPAAGAPEAEPAAAPLALEAPSAAEQLARMREEAIAAGVPAEVADSLYSPRAGASREDDEGSVAAGIAKMRELGMDVAADLLEGKGPSLDLPFEPPAPEPAAQDLRREVMRRLQHGEPLTSLVLTGADLTLLDFTGRDLSSTVLARCDLRQAVLDAAILDGCVLDGAWLDGATFRRASLRFASLDRVQGAGVDFTEAVLEDAFGSRARLPGASFARARAARLELSRSLLAEASFAAADAPELDVSGSSVERADFRAASLSGIRLHGADARGADFDQAVLYKMRGAGCSLAGASLRWCQAGEAVLTRANLREARFTASDLTRATFAEAALDDAELMAIGARGASFVGASLVRTRLWGADLLGATFEGALLAGADLRNANLFRAELWRTDTRGALFDGANLGGTKLA